MRKSLLFSAVAAAGLMVAQANAATLTLTYDQSSGNVDAAYNNTTDFTSVPYNATLNPATTGVVYEIPIYFQISNLGSGENGFGGLDITAQASGSATIDSNYSYFANNATFPLGKGSQAYFATNGEAGTLTSTSAEIVAAIASGVTSQTDARYSMAKSSPFWLGDIYVDVANGQGNGQVTLHVNNFATNNSGTLVNDYGAGSNNSGSLGTISTINFIVPEPASLSLLGMGALGLVARRRRHA